MDIKQLNTFKIAAETLNFTKTAKILNFAQSSVTSQIKSLEKELDTKLFERLGKTLYLTETGKQFKTYADKMVNLSEEAKSIATGGNEPSGTLIIGAQESQCTYRLPPLLKEFQQQFPKVKLIFKPAHSDEVAKEQLLKGNLDVAFIMDEVRYTDSLVVERLVKDEMKIVASPDHRLANHLEVYPQDLKDETLLLTETGCSYRTIFENTLTKAEVYPSNRIEFVSIEALKQCAIAGLGIAKLPYMAVEKDIRSGRLKELKWQSDAPAFFTQIAWHKDKSMNLPLKSFIDLTCQMLKDTEEI
ncbi:LysR family transcriptional regulator [Gracilibacillus saliphilus]|uniref:LysR family transcriptional regulator n=1 Tax=Gracilibacillus saliphilus TaxID=543890 RepID=UPI0013D06571|nr:LysR family transcriptional regulator [Gracilibacillus saliphilus]